MKFFKVLVLAVAAVALVAAGCRSKDDKAAKKAEKQAEPAAEKAEKQAEEKKAEEAPPAAKPEEAAAAEAKVEAQAPEQAKPEAAAAPGEEAITDTVVARVNGADIDAKDYVERLKRITKGNVTRSMLKKTVIDRMVNDELLKQEIKKLNITVTDQEIADAMNMDMERFSKQKGTMGARVQAFEDRVAVNKLLEARGLLAKPTDEELQKEYERRFGLKIDAVTMPVDPTAAPDVVAKAEEQAKGILTAVQANPAATLRDAVKDMKDAEGRRILVKPMFVKKGDERQAAIWTAANPLQEKQYAGPVKTEQGFVVLQLAKRIEPKQTYEEMKDKLAKSALNMKTAQAKHRLLEDIRKEAKVEYLIEFKDEPRPGSVPLRGMRMAPGMIPGGAASLRVPPVVAAPDAAAPAAPAAPEAAAPAPAPAP
jgi:hypothetical protein